MDNDANKIFGTIYLNDEWDVNEGGIFLYKTGEHRCRKCNCTKA